MNSAPTEPAAFWRTVVPPGSTAIRELVTAIAKALDRDNSGDLPSRVAVVRDAARRLARDRDAADEDVMAEVWILRDVLRDSDGQVTP